MRISLINAHIYNYVACKEHAGGRKAEMSVNLLACSIDEGFSERMHQMHGSKHIHNSFTHIKG